MTPGVSFLKAFILGLIIKANETISEVSSTEKPSVEVVNRNDAVEKHARLYGAIYSYRDIGHTQGTFDPLKKEIEENPRLTLERLGLDSTDMQEVHFTGNYLGGVRMKVGELLERLKTTYCGNVGVEYLAFTGNREEAVDSI